MTHQGRNMPAHPFLSVAMAGGIAICLFAAPTSAFAGEAASGSPSQNYQQMTLPHFRVMAEHVLEFASASQKERIQSIVALANKDITSLDQRALLAGRMKFDAMLSENIDPLAVSRAQTAEMQASEQLVKRMDVAFTDLLKALSAKERSQLRAEVAAYRR
jgi:uncharacterized membrane protein